MAKTVKIPDNMRPWEATINGLKYVYPAGTTQEVPDEVAALIERISNVQPEKEPNMPPFAGGAQADMNAAEGEPGHVLNRTHWVEYAELLPPTVAIETGEDNQYMIAPTIEGVTAGGTYTVNYNGTNYECVGADLSDLIPGAVGLGDTGFWETGEPTGTHPFSMAVLPADAAAEMGAGASILPLDGASSATVSISGEVVHKLDPKFLPDDIGGLFTVVIKATPYADSLNVFYCSASYQAALAKVLEPNTLVQAKVFVYVNADDELPVMGQSFYYSGAGQDSGGSFLMFFAAHNQTSGSSFMLNGARLYEDGTIKSY